MVRTYVYEITAYPDSVEADCLACLPRFARLIKFEELKKMFPERASDIERFFEYDWEEEVPKEVFYDPNSTEEMLTIYIIRVE